MVITSAENQRVLGTPHLIGAFCGEFSVGCVRALSGGGAQGGKRLRKQLRTLRTDTVMRPSSLISRPADGVDHRRSCHSLPSSIGGDSGWAHFGHPSHSTSADRVVWRTAAKGCWETAILGPSAHP